MYLRRNACRSFVHFVIKYQDQIIAFPDAVAKAFQQRLLTAWRADKWDALSYLWQIEHELVYQYLDIFGKNFKLHSVEFGHFHPTDSHAKCVDLVYYWTIDETAHKVSMRIVDKNVDCVEYPSLMALMKSSTNETDFAAMFAYEVAALPDLRDFV